jgi:hypothetical protein
MTVAILGWSRTRDTIELAYRVGSRTVTKRCTYDDVDLTSLPLDRVCAELAMMEAIPFAGLARALDLGPAEPYFTERFADLWRKVLHGVSAQWRYQHDRPTFSVERRTAARPPRQAEGRRPTGTALVFCGGGKDSLAAITLLRKAGVPFATFAYSHADYGPPAQQHALIDAMLDAAGVERRHRMRAEDDYGDMRADLICAETPISLVYAMPLVLQFGYDSLVLGHEQSADTPNLQWLGEDVNHQWGKSSEAERLLDGDLEGATYYSILKPLHDGVILSLLHDEPAVRLTHSCNVRKPWCERCAKCAYVWLTLTAYLPREVTASMFTHDLIDAVENERIFRELLGIESHRPFECVGDANEARLAFELCRAKGIGGSAAERLACALPPADLDALAERYLTVGDASNIPASVRGRVLPLMEDAARAARGAGFPVGATAPTTSRR